MGTRGIEIVGMDVKELLELVGLSPEHINRYPHQFSGGQRQRLSIARAILKHRPIYIFDDSFSALDFKTDAALRSALRPRVAASTVFIITQRVATARSSDQIVVLENGRVVGIGRHYDLMTACETYQEIASSQLSAEELA